MDEEKVRMGAGLLQGLCCPKCDGVSTAGQPRCVSIKLRASQLYTGTVFAGTQFRPSVVLQLRGVCQCFKSPRA